MKPKPRIKAGPFKHSGKGVLKQQDCRKKRMANSCV